MFVSRYSYGTPMVVVGHLLAIDSDLVCLVGRFDPAYYIALDTRKIWLDYPHALKVISTEEYVETHLIIDYKVIFHELAAVVLLAVKQ